MQSQFDRANSLLLYCTLDLTGVVLAVGASGAAGLGYSIDSLLQTSFFALLHPDDQPRLQTAFIAFGQNLDATVDDRFWLLKRDGSSVEVNITAQVLQGLATDTVVLVACNCHTLAAQERSPNSSTSVAVAHNIAGTERSWQHQERYRRIIETTNEGIWEIDADSNTSFVNPRTAEMLGYSVEEMLGQPIFAFMNEEWRAIATGNVARRRQGITEQHDFKLRHKDGSDLWVLISASPIFDEVGQYIGATAMVMDITKRKQMEADLRASEVQLSAILDNAIAAIFSFWLFSKDDSDYDSEYIYFSSHTEAIYGYSPDEFIADKHLWRSRVLPEDWQTVIFPTFKDISIWQPVTLEYRFRHKDGTVRWISEHSTARRDETLNCWVFTAVALDITDRKQAEAELRQSEEKFRAIFENAAIGIGLNDATGRMVESNPAWQAMIGYSANELLHLTFHDYTHPDDLATDIAHFKEMLAGQYHSYQMEKRYIRKDGQQFWGRLTVAITQEADGQPQFSFGMVEDITQRKQAEEALKKSETQYRAILTAIPDIIGLIRTDGTYLEILRSNTVRDLIPADVNPVGKNLLEMLPLDHATREIQAVQTAVATGGLQILEQQVWVGGHLQYEEMRVVPCDVDTAVVIVRDISDRKQAELEIQSLNTRLQYLLSTTPAILFSCKLGGEYETTFISENVRDILGYEPQKFLEESSFWINNIHPEDIERILADELVENITYGYEYRFPHANGHYVWLYEQFKVIKVANDDVEMVGYFIDISDRKQADLELRSLNARLQHLLTTTPAIIYSCKPDRDYGTTFISDNVRNVLGYEPQQFTENPSFWLNHIHPEDVERVLTEVSQSLNSNIDSHEYRFLHANGHYCWLRDQFELIRNDANNPIEIVGYMIDVSEAKRAEEALRQSEVRFRTIFEGAAIGITVSQPPDYKIIQSNPAFQRMVGYGADELAHRDYSQFTHPEDLPAEQQLIKQVLQEKRDTYTIEKRYVRKDGQVVWVNMIASLLWDANQQIHMAICLIENINDRKQSEAALRDSEARFRQVFAEAPIGMALSTLAGQITQVNPALCTMLGYSELQLKDTTFNQILHTDDIEAHRSFNRRLFNREISQYKLEKRFLKPNGEIVWVNLTAVLFQESNSGALYRLGMFENITERRAIEQMKDNFISVVSHELRTPITSIRGSLELLATGQMGVLTPEGQEVLSIATSESQRLTRLVNDILDLERLKSGHISLVKKPHQISDLIARSVDSIHSFATELGTHVEVSTVSATVWVDGDRIIQTLTNLLNNAIRFSPPNSRVLVTVRRIDRLEEVINGIPSVILPAVLVEVSDRGRGIPPEKLKIIFEPFEQVDKADSHLKGGTGLGLAICQNIVQQHQGKIWATSTLGHGSSFFFTLPCLREPEKL